MESLIGNVLSFIIGAIATGGAFILLNFIQNRRTETKEHARHEIVGRIGRLCSAIDSSVSAYKLSRISLANLRDSAFTKIDEISSTLNENADTLDNYFVKYIELYLEDKKKILVAEGIVIVPETDTVLSVPSHQSFPATPAAVKRVEEPKQAEPSPKPAPAAPEPVKAVVPPPAALKPAPPVIAPVIPIVDDQEEYAFEESIANQSAPQTTSPSKEIVQEGLVSAQTQVMDFSAAMANEANGGFFSNPQAAPDAFNFEPVAAPAPSVPPPQSSGTFPRYDVDATQEFSFQDVRRMASTTPEASPAAPPKKAESELVTGDEVMGQLDNIFASWGK